MKKSKDVFLLAAIFGYSLWLRFSSLSTPFWVDEFSTAQEAKLILENGLSVFSQSASFFEPNNLFTHFSVAASFLMFGVGEWQARIPMLFFGSLVAVFIYLFAKQLFNRATALVSSLLYVFSYWQITWAQQARGYVMQQLLVLGFLWSYYLLTKKYTHQRLATVVVLSLLGVLTHASFILVIFAIFLHFAIFNSKKINKQHLPKVAALSLAAVMLLLYLGNLYFSLLENLKVLVYSPPNNLSYYHSFLWREQTIISLLALLGALVMFFKDRCFKLFFLLFLPILAYLIFVSFLFTPYVSRYLLPIFPLLLILSGFFISSLAKIISTQRSLIFSLGITLLIVLNGDKFTIKPKPFYSVNHDMREIALLDYNQIYSIITGKGQLEKGRTAVIDTWPDRLKWYLGTNQDYFYVFRWLNSDGLVNGLPKQTAYKLNEQGEKYIPRTGNPNIKLVGELADLKKVLAKFPKGFIWIDDTSLPADVITYAKENFTQELYLEHYPLDDNPYSIWPGTLYSWGFDE